MENKTKRALLIIDMQNDFCSKGGALSNEETIKAADTAAEYITENAEKYDFFITTQDSHGDDYLQTAEGRSLPVPHCIVTTDGWRVRKDIMEAIPKPRYECITKRTFGMDEIGGIIDDIMSPKLPGGGDIEIDVIGVCTDICVVSNVLILKASLPDAKLNVLSDCCAGTTPENHEAALKVMKSCQINIKTENDNI